MAVPLFPDDDVDRSAVLAAARRWLGTPYRHQGARRGVGCDCLGFVLGVWRDVYGEAPAHEMSYSADWAEACDGDPLLDACRRFCRPINAARARAGDLLAFRWRLHLPAKHLAILSEGDAMIHAREGHAVCQTPLTPWWRRHLAGAFAFPTNSMTG